MRKSPLLLVEYGFFFYKWTTWRRDSQDQRPTSFPGITPRWSLPTEEGFYAKWWNTKNPFLSVDIFSFSAPLRKEQSPRIQRFINQTRYGSFDFLILYKKYSSKSRPDEEANTTLGTCFTIPYAIHIKPERIPSRHAFVDTLGVSGDLFVSYNCMHPLANPMHMAATPTTSMLI